jgi:mono/diheme cytochrome c family protein
MNLRASIIAAIAFVFCAGLAHCLRTAGPDKSAVADEPGEQRAVVANERNAASIASGLPGYQKDVSAFFKTYCIRCHGPEKSKGNIDVHALNGDLSNGKELDKWDSVLEMLKSGEMPPIDEPQPTKAETHAIKNWIESGIRDYLRKSSAAKTPPKTRRLTNVEYENTLSDLLGFELDVIDDLPEDPEHHYHFKNTAELMRIGPEQLDRYLEIARSAMRSAIVDPKKPEVFKWRGEWSSVGSDKGLGEDEITAFSGKIIGLSGVPRQGEFRIRLSVSAILPPGHDEVTLQLNMGDFQGGDHNEKASKNIATFTLNNSPDEPRELEFRGRIENHPFSTELETKGSNKGKHVDKRTLRLNVIYDDGTLNDGMHYAFTRQLTMPRAVVNWIELETPVTDVWPPKHHTEILFDSPLRETDELAYVRQVLERFMPRAYRRPVTEPEVERFAKIYELIRPSVENFEAAMRETLAMVLIAPRFLYHTESDPATDKHFAMASRLSYFLWTTMPDRELFDLAAQKKLTDPAVIEQQVLRMLQDERSMRFVEDFTLQWLSIKKALTVPINTQLYPRFLYRVPIGETAGTEMPYLPSTRDYMMQETVGFVGELIRRNASVLNVVDSDFAYLNERLAIHYGVEGVKGMTMRPVPIKPEHHLGGLLTHGSVLIGNGTGTAPHPIYRAVWLREAILGDTVPAPPAEVPALSDSAGESLEKALSIAQLLKKHRTVESCNDCHFRLDPWGIPFEEYNAIGRFQTKVPKDGTRVSGFNAQQHNDLAGYQAYLNSLNVVEVDAKARVPHGPEVNGLRGLKDHLLAERTNDITENVILRLLSYGVGRHLTYRDRFAVEGIFNETQKKGFGIRDILVSICKSNVFRDSNQTKEE